MLTRFRRRFEWRVPAAVASLMVVLALPAAIPSHAAAAGTAEAANWLESQQNDDGGFGAAPGDDSSAALTGWSMLGLEAAGRNPFDVARFGRSPIDYLRGHLDELSSAGDIARTIVALEGAGADPRSFGGRDLVSALLKHRAANGSYVGWPGTTAFAAIALRTAGAGGGLDTTLSWLGGAQNSDGGWGDLPQPPSNADVTGAVMQALPDTKSAQAGLAYLKKHERSSGGFAGGSGEVNSQSTAWAVQGAIAVSADPAGITAGGNSPLDYLAARQAPDGHYRYSSSTDKDSVWVTGQALVAVAGDALPISPPPREKTPATVSPSKTVPPASSPETVPPAETGPLPEAPPASGTGAAPGPVPPATGATPAQPSNEGALPEGDTEAVQPVPEAQSQPVSPSGSSPSPWAPIGIGAAAAALAIGLPWWLGRRFAW